MRQLSVLIRLLLVMIIHSILSSSTVLHLCSIIMDLYLLLDNECIGVIGKRDCSEYGVRATRILVEDLVKQGLVIVSGMAKGIDGVGHRTAF